VSTGIVSLCFFLVSQSSAGLNLIGRRTSLLIVPPFVPYPGQRLPRFAPRISLQSLVSVSKISGEQRAAGTSPFRAIFWYSQDGCFEGADPFTLAAILGHSDIRMTARYTHATDEAKRRAVDKLVAPTALHAGETPAIPVSTLRVNLPVNATENPVVASNFEIFGNGLAPK